MLNCRFLAGFAVESQGQVSIGGPDFVSLTPLPTPVYKARLNWPTTALRTLGTSFHLLGVTPPLKTFTHKISVENSCTVKMRRVGTVLWPKLRVLQVYGANTGVGKDHLLIDSMSSVSTTISEGALPETNIYRTTRRSRRSVSTYYIDFVLQWQIIRYLPFCCIGLGFGQRTPRSIGVRPTTNRNIY